MINVFTLTNISTKLTESKLSKISISEVCIKLVALRINRYSMWPAGSMWPADRILMACELSQYSFNVVCMLQSGNFKMYNIHGIVQYSKFKMYNISRRYTLKCTIFKI